jgi:hypothetical protein
MNIKILFVVAYALLMLGLSVQPSPACRSESAYINQYGREPYEPVQCNCPCWRYKHAADRNQCTECLHYRDPRDMDERSETF